MKRYEALWRDDDGELGSFAGSVGFRVATYDTVAAARDFLAAGLVGGSEVWWDLLAVSWPKGGGER
jgi:hypothetical protein